MWLRDDIEKQWRQEATRGCRRLTRMAISACYWHIQADWIQLPVERNLTALPTLVSFQGCSRTKEPLLGPSLRDQKLQLSVFLPIMSLDDWYAGVHALSTDVSVGSPQFAQGVRL